MSCLNHPRINATTTQTPEQDRQHHNTPGHENFHNHHTPNDARDGALAGWQCRSTHGNHNRPPNNRTADNPQETNMAQHHINDPPDYVDGIAS